MTDDPVGEGPRARSDPQSQLAHIVQTRADLTRKRFVDLALGVGAGALSAAVLYPVGRYLIPPETEEAETKSVRLPLSASDVAPNSGRIFKFGTQPGILIRTPEGELRAFSAICTHLACTVQYRDDLEHIWCACHNGHFDLRGRNVGGPPPEPLPAFDVNALGEQIVVSARD